jgi:hypothetical protein
MRTSGPPIKNSVNLSRERLNTSAASVYAYSLVEGRAEATSTVNRRKLVAAQNRAVPSSALHWPLATVKQAKLTGPVEPSRETPGEVPHHLRGNVHF